jgi:predicted Zn-dependent peptidase
MDSVAQLAVPCDRARAVAFFREHHRPGRSVTVLAGGFELGGAEEIIRSVHRAGDSGPASPPDLPVEPEQEGERIGQLPPNRPDLLCIGYRAPRTARRTHLDVLARLLGSGPGALLWKRLVEQGTATGGDVHASFPGSLARGLFLIDVAVVPGRSPQDARDEVLRVLQALAQQGPAEDDLARAKATARAEVLRQTADPERLASLLAVQSLGLEAAPDPWLLAEDYGAISGSALRETAAALFKPARRTVVFSLPEEKAGQE